MGWNSQDRSQFDRRQSRSEADKLQQHLESTLVIIDWVDFASKCKATIPWIHFFIGLVYVEFIEEENEECFSKDSENQLQHRGALSRSEEKQMNSEDWKSMFMWLQMQEVALERGKCGGEWTGKSGAPVAPRQQGGGDPNRVPGKVRTFNS